MGMNWLEYLELTYPNHLLPFDLRGVNQLLKMQMKAQAVAYDSVVETSLIQLRGLLDRAGFYCAPGAMGKAVVSPSSLPNSAFEDDFDDSGFENLLSSEKPLVKRTYSDNPELMTTKTDLRNHGIGIPSVKRLLERKNGILRFYETEHTFCAQIYLPAFHGKQGMLLTAYAVRSIPQLSVINGC